MTAIKQERQFPVPQVRADNASFWNACKKGILLIPRCTACGEAHWYPRPLCPFCMGNPGWEVASGLGTVYTFSITRRAGPIPYCIAYVQLKEGPLVMTNIVDCDLERVRIGTPVKVVFHQAVDGTMVPMFTLV
jgi:uncharacterized OB-fold protein